MADVEEAKSDTKMEQKYRQDELRANLTKADLRESNNIQRN